jgi:hypothetical protein
MDKLFIYYSALSAIIWYTGKSKPLTRSTIHALIAFILPNFTSVPNIYTATISTGYFISDLPECRTWLYKLHHIMGIWIMWTLIQKPYTNHNIFKKVMIVEVSTPFLNYFLINKNSNRCLIYLLAHIFCRNYMLTKIYLKYIPQFSNEGINNITLGSFCLFLLMNYWWTWRTCLTYRKLILLNKI